jgi:hypothetical protein
MNIANIQKLKYSHTWKASERHDVFEHAMTISGPMGMRQYKKMCGFQSRANGAQCEKRERERG